MASRTWKKIAYGVGAAAAVLGVPTLAYGQQRGWFQSRTNPDIIIDAKENRKLAGEVMKRPTDLTKDQFPTIVQYEKELSTGNAPWVVSYYDYFQIKDKLFVADKAITNDPKDIEEAYKIKIYYNKEFGGEDIGPESIILRIATRFKYDNTAPEFAMAFENYSVENTNILWLKQLARSVSFGLSGVENGKYWAGVVYIDQLQDYVFQVLYTRSLPPGVSKETLDEQTRKMFAPLTNTWAVQSLHYHAKAKELLAMFDKKMATDATRIVVNPADAAPELVDKAKRYTEATQKKVVGPPDSKALQLQSEEFV